MALAALLGRRASPTFRYALWCVVLVRLCFPFSLSLPIGLMALQTGARTAAPGVSFTAGGSA